MRKFIVFGIAIVVLTVFTPISPLFGQDSPTLHKGNLEVGLFAGGGYGLGINSTTANSQFKTTSNNFHVMGGGDIGYAVTKSIFLVGEASYFPSLSPSVSSISTSPTGGTDYSVPGSVRIDKSFDRKVFEFNAGVHYRLPVPESRIVPYLAGGIGAARFLSSSISNSRTSLGGCTSNCTVADPSQSAPGATAFEVAGGAGVRVYATQKFGFRGEFRIYHPFGIANVGTFYRFSGGIFFQLK